MNSSAPSSVWPGTLLASPFGASRRMSGALHCAIPAAGLRAISFRVITKYVTTSVRQCAPPFDEATTHRLAEFATAMSWRCPSIAFVTGCLAVGTKKPALGCSITFAICVQNSGRPRTGALLLVADFHAEMLRVATESTTILGGLLAGLFCGALQFLAAALANAGRIFIFAAHACWRNFETSQKLVLTNLPPVLAQCRLILYFI